MSWAHDDGDEIHFVDDAKRTIPYTVARYHRMCGWQASANFPQRGRCAISPVFYHRNDAMQWVEKEMEHDVVVHL